MIDQIIDHLRSRPIAPLLHHTVCENEIALKVMCILDYLLQQKQLYVEILCQPKLLRQLLGFESYANFHYFEYKLNFPFNPWLLACKCCEFRGAYIDTLEHMALAHGRHESAELCHWCSKTPIRTHIEQSTYAACYDAYLRSNQVSDADALKPLITVVNRVFAQIRYMATKLGVKTLRRDNYQARQKMVKDKIENNAGDDADISNEILVTKTPKLVVKTIQLDQLEKLFGEAMNHFNVAIPNAPTNVLYAPSMGSVYGGSGSAEASNSFDAFESYNQQRQQPIHRMQSNQHHHYRQPQQQQQRQQLPAPVPWMPPIPPDVINVSNLMVSALRNIRNDSIRKQALIDIQQSILKYLADDLNAQMQ